MSPSERTLEHLAKLTVREFPSSVPRFDRDGEPITAGQWVALFEDKSYQLVEQTEVGGLFVSTVWLGLDHSFGRGDRPVLFETMVFDEHGAEGKRGDEVVDGCWRYSTEDEALTGHRAVCEQVRLLEALR